MFLFRRAPAPPVSCPDEVEVVTGPMFWEELTPAELNRLEPIESLCARLATSLRNGNEQTNA
jgi:hypothetical protein